jgi:hypothetical protein
VSDEIVRDFMDASRKIEPTMAKAVATSEPAAAPAS